MPVSPPTKVTMPWEGSLADRLSALGAGSFRVLYFYDRPDTGSFRYRCYNMAQAINSHVTGFSASYIFLSDLDALSDYSDLADVLVVSRTRYDSHVERLIHSFQRCGKTVFFDIDDLIFDTHYVPLVASSLNFDLWGEGLDKWFSLVSRMGATMNLCDSVIVTNPFLARYAEAYSGKTVHVIPNFLNAEQIAESEKIWTGTKENRGSESGLRLGYFSGSKSHIRDFAIVVEPLAQLLEGNPELRLDIVGHLPFPEALEPYTHQIRRRDFTDFVTLQHYMADVDVSIVPLQDNPFTHSKSELKFFEAGAVGVPTIASRAPVFESVITEDVNGLLAAELEWLPTIGRVIGQSRAERQKLGDEARKSALRDFIPLAHAQNIAEVLRSPSR